MLKTAQNGRLIALFSLLLGVLMMTPNQALASGPMDLFKRTLLYKPDPYGNGLHTVEKIISINNDKNHAGGAHYDVKYETSDGTVKTKRFWRDGTRLSDGENNALSNGRKPRRGGATTMGKIGAIGVTMVIVAGVAVVYDYYVETGAAGARRLGERAFTCHLIRAYLHSGDLPEIYDQFGVVRYNYFRLILDDGTELKVFLEPLADSSGKGIHVVRNGEVIVAAPTCPLSGG